MCELCKLIENAVEYDKSREKEEDKFSYVDSLCVIVDSSRDKPKKDGFQPKVAICRFHEMDPAHTTKLYIIAVAKRMFKDRVLWFPQTEDNSEEGKKLPMREWSAHWYFEIE